jgi:hypothetical protein
MYGVFRKKWNLRSTRRTKDSHGERIKLLQTTLARFTDIHIGGKKNGISAVFI